MKRDQLAAIITAVWGLTTLAAVVTKETTLIAIITPVMLAVVGFFFNTKGRNSG